MHSYFQSPLIFKNPKRQNEREDFKLQLWCKLLQVKTTLIQEPLIASTTLLACKALHRGLLTVHDMILIMLTGTTRKERD